MKKESISKILLILLIGVQASFAQQKGSFTDPRDSKKYKTVKIGKQVWMAENLGIIGDGDVFCYDDDFNNCDKYGVLYGWDIAMMACPDGWHLPTNEEWQALITAVGGYETAGYHLKTKSGWKSGFGEDANGLDSYGFAALPGGSSTETVGFSGAWWTASSECANADALVWAIGEEKSAIYGCDDIPSLHSIRCVKNSGLEELPNAESKFRFPFLPVIIIAIVIYFVSRKRKKNKASVAWNCSCGHTNTDKFCGECGKPRA